jgi:hypothetical protein
MPSTVAKVDQLAVAQGGVAEASDEVAVEHEVPAATSAPEPAGNAAEGEASGGVVPEHAGGVMSAE